MNNFYTLRFLVSEFKEILTGTKFVQAVSYRKNRLELYFERENNNKQISVCTDPSRTVMFVSKSQPPKKKNIAFFFQDLEGQTISDISLSQNDRFVTVKFNSGINLLFQLFGSKPNVFLIKDDKIIDSFKKSKEWIEQPAPKPRESKNNEFTWKEDVRSNLLSLNPKLPRTHLKEVIKQNNLDQKTPQDLQNFSDELHRSLMEELSPSCDSDKQICIIPEPFLILPKRNFYPSFNEAVRDSFFADVHQRKEFQLKKQTETILEKLLKKASAKIRQLRKAVEGPDKSQKYEQYGHLLMANIHRDADINENQLEVDNFYEGNRIIIPIKENLRIQEMAAVYYQKSKDAKTNQGVSEQLLKEELARLEVLEKAKDEFENLADFEALKAFQSKYAELLKSQNQKSQDSGDDSVGFNKRIFKGYEILIGRSATNNDELLRYAHKEDIWLHARGLAGSHVIIRMNGNKNFPDHAVLEVAAALAAGHSKGAGSGMVPVMTAKRKHVRKKKGAAPGAVLVEKEEIIMAEPIRKLNHEQFS